MIRFLTGQVIDKDARSLVLQTNGVGYLVTTPETLTALPGQDLSLWIHTHVREDTFALYGFGAKDDLAFFELLITVNGIGPKMAMEIMNEPAAVIQNAILSGNLPALTKISGVGKKLAERLVLELKGKVVPSDAAFLKPENNSFGVDEDAVAALESLGYKRHHIQKVLDNNSENSMSTEELIRYFLQHN
jgi:Holliday junction DNA helicase RuvA